MTFMAGQWVGGERGRFHGADLVRRVGLAEELMTRMVYGHGLTWHDAMRVAYRLILHDVRLYNSSAGYAVRWSSVMHAWVVVDR